jgi:predicted phosphohydrolase
MIPVYAISDLHLSGRPPFKDMRDFGEQYTSYMERIEVGFRSLPDGAVVINSGDISWAVGRAEALNDFRWLNAFGVKIVNTMGNHDYYFGNKGAAYMSGWALDNGLENIYFVDHQKLFTIGYRGLTVAAVRGVERFTPYASEEGLTAELLPAGHREPPTEVTPRSWEKYMRRLEAALALAPDILVSHIPPFTHDGSANEQTALILASNVKMIIYGHRHNTPFTARCNNYESGKFWVNAMAERQDFRPTLIGRISEDGTTNTLCVHGSDVRGVITDAGYTTSI